METPVRFEPWSIALFLLSMALGLVLVAALDIPGPPAYIAGAIVGAVVVGVAVLESDWQRKGDDRP